MEKTRRFAVVINPHPISQPSKENKEEIPPFKWASIAVQEFFEKDCRLDASVFVSEGRQVRADLGKCKWPIVNMCGDGGLATAYHRPRFRRIYLEKSDFPIYQPAQINELDPKPSAYISALTRTDIDALKVKTGQVLLTCSGTIGNCTYVRNTLDKKIFSHDVIRIEPMKYGGFVYAYLKSKSGFLIINTNNYGAVVSHIEPEHLNNIPIPNPPPILKQEIHNLIEKSFELRDESNNLMDEARALLKNALKLPDLEILKDEANLFDKSLGFHNYSVPLSQLEDRLDGSYHIPTVRVIEQHLRQNAQEVTNLGDNRITKSIILPGRFKRVYVREGIGVVFFGGKQLFHLDPANKKYLSSLHHAERIKRQLKLYENMTLITSSGTIGKVTIVPEHWEGWTANQHVIRVVPAKMDIAGYIYAWLSSDYANPLITHFTYGAVVDEIDDNHVSRISVPLLQDNDLQRKINDKVLESNQKRADAYYLEQKALNILNEKVINAR